MTTRLISAQIVYPFEEPTDPAMRPILFGILDAYFFVQGDPTGSSAGDRVYPYVKLVDIAFIGPEYRYTFEAVADGKLWTLYFDLPSSGGMGQVTNSEGTDCNAVLIFDTELLYTGPGLVMAEYIEPSRTEWHNEQLELLRVYNIARFNGVEDSSTLLPVEDYPGGMLRFEDGYNTELSYDEDAENLIVIAGTELGKGRDPGFGDMMGSSSGSSSSTSTLINISDYVSVINGIQQQNGDIPVEVSPLLGIRREPGLLEITVKSP